METRQDKLSILSDLHKSVYGYRPRGKYSNFTGPELDNEFEHLQSRLEVQIEEEKERELQDVKNYKNIVEKTKNYHNIDTKTALCWLLEAEGIELKSIMDVEQHLWTQGILHTEYGEELKPIFTELMAEQLEAQG